MFVGTVAQLGVWLLLTGICHSSPVATESQVTIVYRGDLREPRSIRFQGGFFPTCPTDKMEARHYSVWNHAIGGLKNHETLYVPTSSDKSVALEYVAKKAKGWFRNNGGRTSADAGYIYHIQPTRNFIDVVKTITTRYDAYLAWEKEYAALGGVRWAQVRGWTVVPLGSETPLEKLEYVANSDYDTAFDKCVASQGVPQLAGFPREADWYPGAKLWNEQPWAKYKDKRLDEAAKEFMASVGNEVKWRGDFPLMRPASSAPHLVQEAREAVGRAYRAFHKVHEASGTDKAAASAAVAEGDKAVQDALDLALKVIDVVEEHSYLSLDLVDEASTLVGNARYAAIRTRLQAHVGTCRGYKEQIKLFRQLAEKTDPRWRAAAAKTEEVIAKLLELRRRFRDNADIAQSLRLSQMVMIRKLLETRADVPRWLGQGTIWSKQREQRERGLQRELQALGLEVRAIREATSAMKKEAVEARQEAKMAWNAADRITAQTLQDSKDADGKTPDSGCMVQDVLVELATEILSLAPLLGASLLIGPLGAPVATFHAGVHITKWRLRAWKALKLIRRAVKVSKVDTGQLEKLATRLHESLQNYHARLETGESGRTMEDLLREFETTPARPRSKSLNDVLSEANKMDLPVAEEAKVREEAARELARVRAPSRSQSADSVAMDEAVKETLRQLEAINVPDTDPAVVETLRQLEDIKAPNTDAATSGQLEPARMRRAAAGPATAACDEQPDEYELLDKNMAAIELMLGSAGSDDAKDSLLASVEQQLASHVLPRCQTAPVQGA